VEDLEASDAAESVEGDAAASDADDLVDDADTPDGDPAAVAGTADEGAEPAAEASDADADDAPADVVDGDDPEGDGELVIIDVNGDIISPDAVATATPAPQPVVLGASAEVSGFEITIFISVLDGDGYSIGACGTTVNWGDGFAQDSACDPSCVAVDSSAPASGVDGQLTFTHVYEVRNVQLAPYFTVFTGLECYGDSATVTVGPLLITDDGILTP